MDAKSCGEIPKSVRFCMSPNVQVTHKDTSFPTLFGRWKAYPRLSRWSCTRPKNMASKNSKIQKSHHRSVIDLLENTLFLLRKPPLSPSNRPGFIVQTRFMTSSRDPLSSDTRLGRLLPGTIPSEVRFLCLDDLPFVTSISPFHSYLLLL